MKTTELLEDEPIEWNIHVYQNEIWKFRKLYQSNKKLIIFKTFNLEEK